MSKYVLSEELKALGDYVIAKNDEFEHLKDCRIGYQVTDGHKSSAGKTCYADCEKVKERYKAFIPYDFLITFYADSEELSEESLEILMFHELKHVGYEPEKERCFIVPHDIEDFKEVIRKFGVDWIDGVSPD